MLPELVESEREVRVLLIPKYAMPLVDTMDGTLVAVSLFLRTPHAVSQLAEPDSGP